jgi:hypothetical protein
MLVGKPEGERQLKRLRSNFRIILKRMVRGADCIHLAQDEG